MKSSSMSAAGLVYIRQILLPDQEKRQDSHLLYVSSQRMFMRAQSCISLIQEQCKDLLSLYEAQLYHF